MTLPSQVLPGCDYMMTRRCSERGFFLRPDDTTNNAFILLPHTFTRDSRLRIYGELRVSQNVLGISEYAADATTTSNPKMLGTYYPIEFALQAGVGW